MKDENEDDEDEDESEVIPPPGLPNKNFARIPRNKWKKVRICNTVQTCDFDCGDCDICPVETKDVKMNLKFEVADVKKPLIAVKRICEKGNTVSFGPTGADNFIQNRDTGDKVPLRPSGKGS